jgi:hypothetical protein
VAVHVGVTVNGWFPLTPIVGVVGAIATETSVDCDDDVTVTGIEVSDIPSDGNMRTAPEMENVIVQLLVVVVGAMKVVVEPVSGEILPHVELHCPCPSGGSTD